MWDWLEKWSSQTWPWVAGQKRRKSLAVARVNHMSFDLLITLNHRCYPQMQQTYRVVAWFSSPFCNGQTTTSLKGFPTAPTTNINGFPSIFTISFRSSTPQRVSNWGSNKLDFGSVPRFCTARQLWRKYLWLICRDEIWITFTKVSHENLKQISWKSGNSFENTWFSGLSESFVGTPPVSGTRYI